MAHPQARAWWADVQHLRDDYERTDEARRRADQHDLASRRAVRERGEIAADGAQAHAARRGAPAPAAPRRAPEPPRAPRRGAHEDLTEAHGVPRQRGTGAPGRQTIEIRGRTVPAPVLPRSQDVERRRPPRRAVERLGARPDRMAMWALLMGLALILVAIGTADTPGFVALMVR